MKKDKPTAIFLNSGKHSPIDPSLDIKAYRIEFNKYVKASRKIIDKSREEYLKFVSRYDSSQYEEVYFKSDGLMNVHASKEIIEEIMSQPFISK